MEMALTHPENAIPWHFLFSIVLEADARPAFPSRLSKTLESLKQQSYRNFEVIILGAGIKEVLQGRPLESEFITFRGCFFEPSLNGIDVLNHPAVQSVLRGEHVMFLPAGSTLEPSALACVNQSLNRSLPGGIPDLLLCDYDYLSEAGHVFNPCFTPGWDPDFITACDYIGSSFTTSKDLLEQNRNHGGPFSSLYEWLKGLACPGMTFTTGHVTEALIHLPGEENDAFLSPGNPAPPVYALPTPPPGLAVVIPNKDHPDLLERCLGFTHLQTGIPLEIIIVDNGSTDEKVLRLYTQLQADHQARIVRMDGSFNLSRMINQGVASIATSNVVMLLNPAVEISQPGLMEQLLAHALRPEVGVVGSKLLYSDGTIQQAGVLLESFGPEVSLTAEPYGIRHVMRGAPRAAPGPLGCLQTIRNYQAVTAAFMMFRRDVFNALDGFNEVNLPVEYGDIDFCLRAREAGYRVICLPLDGIFHQGNMQGNISRMQSNTPSLQGMRWMAMKYMEARWPDPFRSDPYNNPRAAIGGTVTELSRA